MLNPEYVDAYFYRALAKKSLMAPDRLGAIEDFNKVLELNPGNLNTYYERGNTKLFGGDPSGAIEDYNKVLELDPEYAYAYFGIGRAKHHQDDYTAAIEYYNKAIELEPLNEFFLDAKILSYSNRGSKKYRFGDETGAREDFKKCIELEHQKSFDIRFNYIKNLIVETEKNLEIVESNTKFNGFYLENISKALYFYDTFFKFTKSSKKAYQHFKDTIWEYRRNSVSAMEATPEKISELKTTLKNFKKFLLEARDNHDCNFNFEVNPEDYGIKK